MGTTKHTNLTVGNLRVTGQLIHDGAPEPVEAAELAPANPIEAPALPGEKPTARELGALYTELVGKLVEAGILTEAAEAPASAPQTVEVQTPVLKAETSLQGTPQAVAAGVVDGA